MNGITVESIKGEVIGLQKHSKTKVYSSGGGGYVGKFGGYVSSPNISSSSTEIVEFFLRTANGSEEPVKLANITFPVRNDHSVTMVWVENVKMKKGRWVAAANHDTGKKHFLCTDQSLIDLKIMKRKLKISSFTSLLILLLSCGLFALIVAIMETYHVKASNNNIFMVLAIPFISYLALYVLLHYRREKGNKMKLEELFHMVDDQLKD